MNIAPLVNEQNLPEGLVVTEFTPLLVDQYVGCYFGSQFQDLLRYTSSAAEQRPAWCRFFPRVTFQSDPPRAEFLLTRLIDGESRDVTANAIPVSTQNPVPDDELNAFCDALTLLLARLDEQTPLVPNAQKFLRELRLPDPAFPEATPCYRLYDDGSGHQRLLVLWGIGDPIPTLHLQTPNLLRQRFADAKLIGSPASTVVPTTPSPQLPASHSRSRLLPAIAIAAALLLVASGIALLLQRSPAAPPTPSPETQLALATTPHTEQNPDRPVQQNARPDHHSQVTPTAPADDKDTNRTIPTDKLADSQAQSPEKKSISSENQSQNAVKDDTRDEKATANGEKATQDESRQDVRGDKQDVRTETNAVIYEKQSEQNENQSQNAVKDDTRDEKAAANGEKATQDESRQDVRGDKQDVRTETNAVIYEKQSEQNENQSQNAVKDDTRDEKAAAKDEKLAQKNRQQTAHDANDDRKDEQAETQHRQTETETIVSDKQADSTAKDTQLVQAGKLDEQETIQQQTTHGAPNDGSRHVADNDRLAAEKRIGLRPPHIRCLPSIPLDQPTQLVITTALLDHDLQPNSARLVSLRLLHDDGQPALAPLSLQDMTAIFDLSAITRPTTPRWQGIIAF